MAEKYDILLRNGDIVDPLNAVNGRFDLAMRGNKVVAIGEDLDASNADEIIDLEGRTAVPGLVDLHVHASAWIGGRFGHKMMAQAGVTTALDMSGPIDSVVDMAAKHGAGLNLACIHYVRPGHTVDGEDPGKAELAALLDACMARGAIGFKILGGHYPMTPDATARTIAVAAERGAYIAFHAGTLATGSNIEGVVEAADLAQGKPMHLPHINSYCRGKIQTAVEEGETALSVIESNPNICSESYLATINGTSAGCTKGVPDSNTTKTGLMDGGFPATEQGMEDAILAGWALINLERGGTVNIATGPEAVAYWRARHTEVTVSFRVNPPEPRLRLATAKRASGDFVVDCLATDGGGIPRNETVMRGLALVRLEALTMDEFALKASTNPARILGLKNKGHLGVGADADVTVVDLDHLAPVMAFSNGRMIMHKGHVCGAGTRMITTPTGEARIREAGLEPLVVDPAERTFCRRS
jgi:hypothetical protein